MNVQVVCLQEYPELIDQCVDLLNSQWPRSKTARLRSLQQYSSQSFPTSLVLLDVKQPNKKDVIGHCKISPVPNKTDICFVESVVISLTLRGKGLGKLIMQETENFVKAKGIKTIYLTTYDQQEFYKKLGYSFCEPIQLYGGASPAFHKFIEQNQQQKDICTQHRYEVAQTNQDCSQPLLKSNDHGAIPKPPPPPPLPPASLNVSGKPSIIVIGNDGLKVTMKKSI